MGGGDGSGAEGRQGVRQEDVTLDLLRDMQRAFAEARAWEQYHTPRNLVLALVGEVGELAECFQWLGDEDARPGLPGIPDAKRNHIGEELSDVLLYLVRLADVCGIDLSEAVLDKISKNAKKYPSDKAFGSSAKYTAYQ